MMSSNVQVERCGSAAIVRLNRPERGNSLDGEQPGKIRAAVVELARDEAVRGIVLTGNGRLFCAGGDIETLADWRDLDLEGRTGKYLGSQGLVLALQDCPVPVVAALNGPAAGAGVDLALAADLRIAVPTASMTAAFSAVGLVPDLGGSWFLARHLGRMDALSFLLGGRRLSSSDAADLGLVDRIVPEEDLIDTACALIEELTANVDRVVVAETLRALRGADQHDLKTSMSLAASAQAHLMATPEHEERIAAFLSNAR